MYSRDSVPQQCFDQNQKREFDWLDTTPIEFQRLGQQSPKNSFVPLLGKDNLFRGHTGNTNREGA